MSIFFATGLFTLMFLCLPYVHGQIPPRTKAPVPPARVPPSKQQSMIKLEPKYEIKKFYIVNGFDGGNKKIPFTAMVTVKNAGDREAHSEVTTGLTVVYLDENKKLITEMETTCFDCGRWRTSGGHIRLGPGQSAVVKIPLYSPSAKPSPQNEFSLKGKKWKIGIRVTVWAADRKCRDDKNCEFLENTKEYWAKYVDFLPEQYIRQ